ncbi:MAG: glycerate kinase [Verrucomicrobiota bacterium]
MHILIAPDKFKGSLAADTVARIVADELKARIPAAKTKILPIADGGEGTASILTEALGGRWVPCTVSNALGREVEAGYGLIASEDETIAVLEMSSASGLAMIPEHERDPWSSSTLGTGQLMTAAMDAGADKIIVGLGGSATNDGGSGMARALGFQFLDATGAPVDDLPSSLDAVTEIVYSLERDLPEIVAACDVDNPLLGERGAIAVFGPQKGVTDEEVGRFENRLRHLADLVACDLGTDPRDVPGAGAAGGLGFGLLAFAEARLESGFDLVAGILGIEDAIRSADIVITGEGKLDEQTLMGKGPGGIARMAKEAGKPVIGFCGRAGAVDQLATLFDAVFPVSEATLPVEESMARAGELLKIAVAKAADRIQEWDSRTHETT